MREYTKFLVITLGILLSSCINIDDYPEVLMVSATIKLLSPPEGCGDFIIETANDNVLFPLSLDKEYRVDGLEVRIVYDFVDGISHPCGPVSALPGIELLAIEQR